MTKTLATTTLQQIEKLINSGLQHAGQSLEKILQTPVHAEAQLVEDKHISKYKKNLKSTDYIVLSTDIIGSPIGKSLLIFTQQEAEKLSQHCLSKPYENNEEMTHALLLEIDNMLTAAVVTTLSNTLETELFGDIPSIQWCTKEELQSLLGTQIKSKYMDLSSVFIKSTLSNTLHINPRFIWLLNENFAELISSKTEA